MNGTAQTAQTVLNSSVWYTYEDTTCAPMDSFGEEIGGRLFSNDLANLTVGTLDECARLCLANDTCKSFDYDEVINLAGDGHFCALGSGSVGEFGRMQTVDGFAHHERVLPGCIPARARCGLYNVTLNTQPVSIVTVVPNHDHQITVNPPSIQIDPREWTVSVTFEICAVDDYQDHGLHSSEIWHTVTSDDSYYNGIPLHNVTVDITDDDFAGVTSYCGTWCCFESEEGGNSTVFLMALDTEPAFAVNISILVDDTVRPVWWGGSAAQVTVGESVSATPFLSWHRGFDGGNATNTTNGTNATAGVGWHQGLPITLDAFDDLVVEGLHYTSLTILVSSDDPKYNFSYVPPCQVRIHDNDKVRNVIIDRLEMPLLTNLKCHH